MCSLIIAFAIEGVAEGEEVKINWKDVEKQVKETYPKLKIMYARGDDKGGHLAISNLRLKSEFVDKLVAGPMAITEKSFKFTKIDGEVLKEFWQTQGGHYNFCI